MFKDDRLGMQVSLKPLDLAVNVAARLGVPSPRAVRWHPVRTTGRAWSYMVEDMGMRLHTEFDDARDLVADPSLAHTARRYSAECIGRAVDRKEKRTRRSRRYESREEEERADTSGPWFVRASKAESPLLEQRSDEKILIDKLHEADVRSWLMHEQLVAEYVGSKRKRYFTLSVPSNCRCLTCGLRECMQDLSYEPLEVTCVCCGDKRVRFVRCTKCEHVYCAECCAATNWVA